MIQEVSVTNSQNKQSGLSSFVPNGSMTDTEIIMAIQVVRVSIPWPLVLIKNLFQAIFKDSKIAEQLTWQKYKVFMH